MKLRINLKLRVSACNKYEKHRNSLYRMLKKGEISSLLNLYQQEAIHGICLLEAPHHGSLWFFRDCLDTSNDI